MSYFSIGRMFAGLAMPIIASTVMFQDVYAQQDVVTETAKATPAAPTGTSNEETSDLAAINLLFPDANVGTIITVTELKDLLMRFVGCGTLEGSVVEYEAGAPFDSKLWMTASKTGFCRVAIQPKEVDKPIVCDISAQDASVMLSQDNLDVVNQFDPVKGNVEDLLKVARPLLDCYKNRSASAPSPTAVVPSPSQSNVTPSSVLSGSPLPSGPASVSGSSSGKKSESPETYDYGKMLQ